MRRAIHILPELDQWQEIAAVRSRYDPIGSKIPPHITLVFPFVDDLPTEMLVAHLEAITKAIMPFIITLGRAEQHDEYIWLPVNEGRAAIELIHQRLYTGPLRKHLSPFHPYIPHITLARTSPDLMAEAFAAASRLEDKLRSTADTIVLEGIHEDETSEVLHAVLLNGMPNTASHKQANRRRGRCPGVTRE